MSSLPNKTLRHAARPGLVATLLLVLAFPSPGPAAPAGQTTTENTSAAEASGLQVGAPFPALADFGLEGPADGIAGRVALIDFWATWCAPCKASFPVYDAFQREFAERGFTVLGVNIDAKAAAYESFLKRHAPAFPTVRDADRRLAATVRPPSMPACYLLDRRGVVRLVHRGFHGDADAALLRAEILKLLDEKP